MKKEHADHLFRNGVQQKKKTKREGGAGERKTIECCLAFKRKREKKISRVYKYGAAIFTIPFGNLLTPFQSS